MNDGQEVSVAVVGRDQAAKPLNRALFARRADEVLDTVLRLRGELGLDESIRVAIEQYVDGEEHRELRRLAEVIAFARRQALIQQRLDDDREQLHHGDLDHEKRVSVGHHYEMLRHEACEYNHLLRDLIEHSGTLFTRDLLMRWLVEASQGRMDWAKGEVTGAISEIALHAALQGLPELRGVRYATVEEDLAGYDFVAEYGGKLLTLDAKTGFYRPLSERKHGHKHLEISVPREAIEDFRVTRKGLDLLRREVRQALNRGPEEQHHVSYHASRHHFRGAHA
jgi:hypothetical protein